MAHLGDAVGQARRKGVGQGHHARKQRHAKAQLAVLVQLGEEIGAARAKGGLEYAEETSRDDKLGLVPRGIGAHGGDTPAALARSHDASAHERRRAGAPLPDVKKRRVEVSGQNLPRHRCPLKYGVGQVKGVEDPGLLGRVEAQGILRSCRLDVANVAAVQVGKDVEAADDG